MGNLVTAANAKHFNRKLEACGLYNLGIKQIVLVQIS
jgi:hypothetical protein